MFKIALLIQFIFLLGCQQAPVALEKIEFQRNLLYDGEERSYILSLNLRFYDPNRQLTSNSLVIEHQERWMSWVILEDPARENSGLARWRIGLYTKVLADLEGSMVARIRYGMGRVEEFPIILSNIDRALLNSSLLAIDKNSIEVVPHGENRAMKYAFIPNLSLGVVWLEDLA